jgi:hypothetical protein
MAAVFNLGDRSDEILDLTAPASATDGIVARWLREALARDTSATGPRPEQDEPSV